MNTYTCWDESGVRIEIEADTAREAAEEYVSDGDYSGTCPTRTWWVHVHVYVNDGSGTERVKVQVDPVEPRCLVRCQGHDWQAPIEVVGGLEENPGVRGHGGGVIFTEVCTRCGRYRVTDTWAQDRMDGEQGLESVEYCDADDVSRAYLSDI